MSSSAPHGDEPKPLAADVRVRPEDGTQDDLPQEPGTAVTSEIDDTILEDLPGEGGEAR